MSCVIWIGCPYPYPWRTLRNVDFCPHVLVRNLVSMYWISRNVGVVSFPLILFPYLDIRCTSDIYFKECTVLCSLYFYLYIFVFISGNHRQYPYTGNNIQIHISKACFSFKIWSLCFTHGRLQDW